MEYSISNFKNLSLTQTLFKSRLSDRKAHEKKGSNTIVCPHKVSVNEGKDAS